MVDYAILAFNFSAGLLAFLSPCGLPMLPAFVAYYLGSDEQAEAARRRSTLANVARGLLGGALVGLGAFLALSTVGALAVLVGGPFKERVVWIELFGGLLVMGLGIAMLLGKEVTITPRFRATGSRGLASLALFGALYAAVGAGCVAATLIGAMVDAIAAPTRFEGFLRVGAYAAGVAIPLLLLTLTVSITGTGLVRKLNAILPYVKRVSGVVLVAAGLYLVWYWYRVEFLIV